jgi:hypothetical protein
MVNEVLDLMLQLKEKGIDPEQPLADALEEAKKTLPLQPE